MVSQFLAIPSTCHHVADRDKKKLSEFILTKDQYYLKCKTIKFNLFSAES